MKCHCGWKYRLCLEKGRFFPFEYDILANYFFFWPAFILYRQHWQSIVVQKNPGMANPEISKVIGEQWRQLSEEEKNEWKALAEVRIPLDLLVSAHANWIV